MVFGQDGRFGYESLIERANSDLASGWGIFQSHPDDDRALLRCRIPSGDIDEEAYCGKASWSRY